MTAAKSKSFIYKSFFRLTYSLRLGIILFLSISFLQAWGWNAHRFINEKAVELLPTEMGFFSQQQDYLVTHSIDPDTDGMPGYYHYIDIDYYPGFFQGTLPHTWDEMVAQYGENVVISNGTVPWVIDQWMIELTNAMEGGYWDSAWLIAAELGHYVADSHQALHLTLNYNGSITGNFGIHSRYESDMVNRYLSEVEIITTPLEQWTNVLDSVFLYIDQIYPIVDLVMQADDMASDADTAQGSLYYSLMWTALDSVTSLSLNMAANNLANIWYTAWLNAGSPVLSPETELRPEKFMLVQNYPNPFNPSTTIQYQLAEVGNVNISIYDVMGAPVRRYSFNSQVPGNHTISWDGRNDEGRIVASGTYILRLNSGNYSSAIKLLLIR